MPKKERHPDTRWTVYGSRSIGRDAQDRPLYAGVHADRLPNPEAAKAFLTGVLMEYGGDNVQAVVVELSRGKDENGHRRVVYRVNGGKAWWE